MTEEEKVDNQEKETPTESAPEQKTEDGKSDSVFPTSETEPAVGSDKPSDEPDLGSDEGNDIQIPKARLDEEISKRKELEKKFEDSQKTVTDLSSKIQTVADGLSGKSAGEQKDAIADFMLEHNVPADQRKFMEGFINIAVNQSKQAMEPELAPAKVARAEQIYNAQYSKLVDEIPEAGELSSDDRDEFKKLAHQKENLNTPLVHLYKSWQYDRPEGKKKTVEGGRGGASRGGGEVDINSMNLKEFEEWSNRLAKEQD